ncbi:MAG TPA: MFS transporter, partial [Polyangiaceae bacterium]
YGHSCVSCAPEDRFNRCLRARINRSRWAQPTPKDLVSRFHVVTARSKAALSDVDTPLCYSSSAVSATPNSSSTKLPKTVIGLGLVSLLTDTSSETIFPLIPAFLTGLGASNAAVGLIEGAAELVANLLKYWTGIVSDRRARLKPLVVAGYGISTLIRPLVAFAMAPWHVLLVRIGDRVGKGVRTSPRDALIAAATQSSVRAKAYGFHRAMDHAGAALGTLLGICLLWFYGVTLGKSADLTTLRHVFLWAAVPGFFALIALLLTPEPTRQVPLLAQTGAPTAIPPALRRALVPVALFACANATDAFILVKAARLGASVMVAPLLWLTLHVVKASTATFGGQLADRFGKRNALCIGWTLYAVTWSMVGGIANSMPWLFALTALYGTSHAMVEGAEKALVISLAGAAKGKAIGLYNLVIGLSALVASTTFGSIWDRFGSVIAFVGSGAVALIAAIGLLMLVPADTPDKATPQI